MSSVDGSGDLLVKSQIKETIGHPMVSVIHVTNDGMEFVGTERIRRRRSSATDGGRGRALNKIARNGLNQATIFNETCHQSLQIIVGLWGVNIFSISCMKYKSHKPTGLRGVVIPLWNDSRRKGDCLAIVAAGDKDLAE